jgi:hypothetical protein
MVNSRFHVPTGPKWQSKVAPPPTPLSWGHLICRRLLEGETLKSICQGPDMPADSTVRLSVLDNVQGFAEQYACARLVGYHTMADDMLDIADNPETDAAAVNRDRLKVDTRKWLLSKALPKIYGDRVTAEVTGKDGGPLKTGHSLLETAQRVAFLLTRGVHEADEGRAETPAPLH